MEKVYKVIEILNSNELIVNYGQSDGAKEGRKLNITVTGENVIDPETNKILGTLDIIKQELEVYKVYSNFSICRHITYEQRDYSKPFGIKTKTVEITHPLNIKKDDATNRWPTTIPPVEVGDVVNIL